MLGAAPRVDPKPGTRSASSAFALMAKLPLRFPAVTGPPPVPSPGIPVPGPPTALPLGLLNGKFAPSTGMPFPAVPPEPKTFPFIENGPSNQSNPSSLRLFWLISTNFDSISTCFGCDAFAWSTKASTISRLSCVLRTISVPLCGQNVALAPGGNETPMLLNIVIASSLPTS